MKRMHITSTMLLLFCMIASSLAFGDQVKDAKNNAMQGMMLIQSGKYAEGWEKCRYAKKIAANDAGIKNIVSNMAYYILKKSLQDGYLQNGLKTDELLDALKPYTKNGRVYDPFDIGAKETIYLSGKKPSLSLNDIKMLRQSNAGEVRGNFSLNTNTAKIDLSQALGSDYYRTGCYYFRKKEPAVKSFDQLKRLLPTLNLRYPVVLEIYEISDVAHERYMIRSNYVVAITLKQSNYDDLLLKRKVDAATEGQSSYQGNEPNLMNGIRNDSQLISSISWAAMSAAGELVATETVSPLLPLSGETFQQLLSRVRDQYEGCNLSKDVLTSRAHVVYTVRCPNGSVSFGTDPQGSRVVFYSGHYQDPSSKITYVCWLRAGNSMLLSDPLRYKTLERCGEF